MCVEMGMNINKELVVILLVLSQLDVGFAV